MKVKYKRSIAYVTPLLSLLLSIYISSFNGSSNTNATTLNKTTSTNTTVRVNTFCSMTARINPGEEHTAVLVGGQYKDDIGVTTIQTFCNDPNGYAIYAIGYTDGDSGVASNKNTVLHSSVLGDTYDIPTATNTSGDTSSWAMKLSSVSGTYEPTILSDDNGTFSDYHIVPQSYTKVADYTSNTDLATIGSNLTTTYAAYIKPDQPAGTYEGQVKYILVHPASNLGPDYYYMQNVEDWGPTIAVGQEVTAYDSRDNKTYTVRRMCMSGTGDNCAMEESMLWMTQNLDLDLNSSVALNSIDTDLNGAGSGAYLDGYTVDSDGIIYWTPLYSTSKTIISGGYFTGPNGRNIAPFSADPDAENPSGIYWYFNGVFDGTLYNPDSCNVDGNQTCNFLNAMRQSDYFKKSPFEYNGSHGKLGNYYNWSAAIASNNSSSFYQDTYNSNNVSDNPSNSICPSGWRLPTMSSHVEYNEFMQLNDTYNGGDKTNIEGLIRDPVYMIAGGNTNENANPSLNGAGYYGGYWSSTTYDETKSYFLYFGGTSVGVSNTKYDRYFGLGIRCVSDY